MLKQQLAEFNLVYLPVEQLTSFRGPRAVPSFSQGTVSLPLFVYCEYCEYSVSLARINQRYMGRNKPKNPDEIVYPTPSVRCDKALELFGHTH